MFRKLGKSFRIFHTHTHTKKAQLFKHNSVRHVTHVDHESIYRSELAYFVHSKDTTNGQVQLQIFMTCLMNYDKPS
jgi:hypothetical protein